MTNDAYVDHVRDLLASIPDLRFRRMFGGTGVYSGPRMFGLIAQDQLYIKADEASRPGFQDAGSAPFVFESKGRVTATSYWRIPASAEDDAAEAERWARLGVQAADQAHKPKRPRATARADLGPGPWDE